MSRDFSGRDVVKVLRNHGYQPDHRSGSHVVLEYTNPDTGEVRVVTVSMHDRIRLDTLQKIADQAGAVDFRRFCEWIDDNC